MAHSSCTYAPIEARVEEIFGSAFALCAHCEGIAESDVWERLKEGDPATHSTFRYGLAKGLSAYLSSLGGSFQEIHVRGSAIGTHANPASDIDVVLVVKKQCDELSRLIGLLDAVITICYRKLVGLARWPESLLDVQIIEADQLALDPQRCATLGELNGRPVCLWRASPEAKTGAPSHGAPGNRYQRMPSRS